ncbi:uncharacterized protein CDAR_469641 [Caerostris darwini]|uniref:Uncharacterized protein n=1 Tax=Caerostris darwini TaxID=1538125 RepID=A0AAV4RNW1_9ARAC|nr:uncharacterized protein CDAR_469641 [Caerostris darwini]
MNLTNIRRRRTISVFLLAAILLLAVWVWKTENPYLNDIHVIKLVKNRLFLSVNSVRSQRMKNPGLILDTPGCRIPKLDPFDPSIIELYEAKEPYPCPGPPLFMSSKPGGSVSLNATILETHYKLKPNEISCYYQAIRRKYEKPGNVRENDYDLLPPQRLRFDTPLNEDHVKVVCDLKGKENFTQYFPLVRLKKEVEENRSSIAPPIPRLNIILAGVDSISKLSFLRHFRKTYAFIKNQKTFFDMKGYTKVGDNTFPNLNPMLTGRFVQDIWNESVKDIMYFDDVDIIWKRFAKKGYRTFYAEDSPYFGLYNYGRRGFNETPVDYYMRPLYLDLHNSEVRNKGPFYCFNSQLEPDLMYDYLRDFVRTMGPRPYFAFAMVSSLTHDYFNHAGYADYPTVQLLEDLWEMGAQNDSVVIVFGDHGLRFGSIRSTYVGKFEERMPFMYIHFPPWFVEQYPEIANNIRTNQERLITLFDIHATLVQLLDPLKELNAAERTATTPYGLSLLGEISPYRTCETASVYTHWCCCQVLQEVSPSQVEVLKSAEVVVECINNELRMEKSPSCPELSPSSITSAKLGQLNDLVLRFVKHENIVEDRNVVYGDRIVKYEDYILEILTKPNGAVFESTVRHDVVDDSYCVVDIHEKFSDEQKSTCIDTQRMKQFKYCNA